MEFVGQIKEIGQVRQVNGYNFRDIVVSQINYNNGSETNVCFTVINEKINFNGQRETPLKQLYDDKVLRNGNMLKILFTVSARQSKEGKWFNSVNAWGINTLDYLRGQKPQPQNFQQSMQQTQYQQPVQNFQQAAQQTYQTEEAPF